MVYMKCSGLSSKNNNLKSVTMFLRVISAIVGVPILMAAVWAGLPWFSLLVAIFAALGTMEFYKIAERREAQPAVLLGIAWSLCFIISGHKDGWPTPWVAMGGVALSFCWHSLSYVVRLPFLGRGVAEGRGFKNVVSDWGYTTAGAIYLGWTLSLFLILREQANGLEWVLLVLLGTFATDTGAFLIGITIGRRAMVPRVSPGKTWEGAIGGFTLGAGTAVAVAIWLNLPISIFQSIVLGALIGVSAQVGDLVESVVKRASNMKDSGNLIPGHGGIMDRLDSVVLVIVVVYHFFAWIVK